ncbi:MAG TPA: S8 family serine peptidase [Chitinophaga sp.]|nr:S8 family serine peptidase [Chitinophaga sp.]
MKIRALILLTLFITNCLSAQERTTADSIVIRYSTPPSASGYYLVKYRTAVATASLQKHGLIRSVSPRHHIVQHAGFDSLELKQILLIVPANNNWKCSDGLLQQAEHAHPEDSILVQATLAKEDKSLQYCRITATYPPYPVVTALVKKDDWTAFTAQRSLSFADRLRKASTEILVSNALPSSNYINALQQQYPELQGEGQVIGLKEEKFDTTDIDLLDKAVPSALAAATTSEHATIMGTLIAGAGNSGPSGHGVAPRARLSSSTYNRLLPDDPAYFRNAGITLQNHSYGTGIENYYGAEAVAYDQLINAQDTLLHVFSSGNSGNQAPASGTYQGLAGYANLSGTFKQAKNVLVAGGIDTSYGIPVLSSKGPSYDGRIVPQVVAYGQAGTSDAAATTTGIAAIVQEAYRQTYSATPAATLVKTILINSADDIGNLYPDYSSGFGLLNALEAVRTVKDKRLFNGTVTAGGSQTFPLAVPANTRRLKVTLGWNDPAATTNTAKALVNDLDLWVTDEAGNRSDPWVLSAYPSADSLARTARRGRDSINNQEQVTIDFPAGNLQLHVNARTGSSQSFFLAYQFMPLSSLDWKYPAAGDMLTAGRNIAIRWHTLQSGTGTVSFSADSGATWIQIATNVSLTGGTTRWQVPAAFTQGLLRISTTDTAWTSNYFSISTPPEISTGLNCADSALLYWPAQANTAGYEVYTLSGDALTFNRYTTDTFLLFSRQDINSVNFAVRPMHKDGWAGLKSNTVNFQEQGVGCYFRQVLADVDAENQVNIFAVLSSLHLLKTIVWERRDGNIYVGLDSMNISSSLNYQYTDTPPASGLYFYRIKLVLTDGRTVYSDVQQVQVLRNQDFHVFPVPASGQLTLMSRELGNYTLQLTDMNGHTILTQRIVQLLHTVSLQGIPPGIYICAVYNGSKKVFVKKVVVIL